MSAAARQRSSLVWRAWPLCLLAAVVLSTRGMEAHEIGTTRVSVVFQQSRTCRIEIITDASSLVDKLETAAGRLADLPSTAAALQARLQASDDIFRQRVALMFDESSVRPDIMYSVADPANATASPVATITLTGGVPEGAGRFTWKYSWTFATYAFTVDRPGFGPPTTEWLEGGQSSAPISLMAPTTKANRMEIALRYLALGFTHIVPKGLDHMLFVLGIFLLSRRPREVLMQVSAFTIAHSITLALSVYDVLSVSPRAVEPMIAVSIAYVAVENIVMSELRPWRVALVFAFGLLHGMGFAGALKELGLPRSEFVPALVTFNVGVEAGQLAVIGAAFVLVGWYCNRRVWYRQRVVVPASAMIACTAVYWTIERLAS